MHEMANLSRDPAVQRFLTQRPEYHVSGDLPQQIREKLARLERVEARQ